MPSYRIMIVEDQREVSRLLHSALDTLEYDLEVVERPSGEEAILDSSQNPVDLLVSDFRLPGITGIELMDKVRKDNPSVKVFLITGLTDPKIRKQVAEAGADAFFIKPIPIADFLDSVERHLGLVETILPPEPIASLEGEEIQSNLPDLLVQLRQDIRATAILLLNDAGHVLASAGALPDGKNEIALLFSLLAIFSAGQKVSRLIGGNIDSNWHIFEGVQYDIIFSPLGSTHALLVVGEKLTDAKNMLKNINSISTAQRTLEQAIIEVPKVTPAIQESPTTPLDAVEQTMKEMAPLFQETRKKLKPAEVDKFWDKAADGHKAPTKPDMLSYEQARQLGLAPKDKP